MAIKKSVHAEVDRQKLYAINPGLIKSVRVGRSKQAGKGLAIGVLAGSVGGALIGYATYDDSPNDWFDFGPGFNALGGAIIGTLIGGLTGLVVTLAPARYTIDGNRNNYKAMQLKFYKRLAKKDRKVKK